jgi:DMSO/TMAO reductase YedYZ molybdopterin-dependent catalytic subunit
MKQPGPGDAESAGRPIGRRVLLASAAATALGVAFGAKAQEGLQRLLLPLTLHDPTGVSDLLPVAGRFRIYSVTNELPSRSTTDWSLRVDGLVDHPTTFSYNDVTVGLPQTMLNRDFQCVTGWRVHDVEWSGVLLRDVLDRVQVQPNASYVGFTSFDGEYTETLSLDQARRDDVLIAHTMQNAPLSSEHGGPVRLYVAPMYGYKSLKWLDSITVTDQLPGGGGFWEHEGYDIDAWTGRSNGGHEAPT